MRASECSAISAIKNTRVGWGRMLSRPPAFNPFACPNCDAYYQVVKVEADPETNDRELACRSCGGRGKFVLKYFLLRNGAGLEKSTGARRRASTNWDSPNCKTRSFYRRIFLDGFWAWSLASHLVEILRRVGTRSAPHRLKSKTSGVAARSHGIFGNHLGASGTAGPLRDSVYPRWSGLVSLTFMGEV
jgi:hypothetical protein